MLLQNRIYRGEIVHKDQSRPGGHEAISTGNGSGRGGGGANLLRIARSGIRARKWDQGGAHGECSAHTKTFGIGFGRILTFEYYERAIEPGCSLVPIVLPIASLYGADHALFLWVGVPLSVGCGLLRSRAAK
jgi:hypothetical protein